MQQELSCLQTPPPPPPPSFPASPYRTSVLDLLIHKFLGGRAKALRTFLRVAQNSAQRQKNHVKSRAMLFAKSNGCNMLSNDRKYYFQLEECQQILFSASAMAFHIASSMSNVLAQAQ